QYAIDDAMSQLDPKNPSHADCIGLFKGFTNAPDPSDVLAKLAAGNTAYGTIAFGTITDPNTHATTAPILNGPDDTPWIGALITLNNSWSGAFLADTSAHGHGISILHELVHAFEQAFQGKSPFENELERNISEDERTARSERNTQKITDNCFK